MNKREEIKNLVSKLNKYSYNYYSKDKSLVSDYEYDELYDRLVELEKETGIIVQDSPTKRVGDIVIEKFDTYTHPNPLYSLDKCQSLEELVIWLEKIKQAFPKTVFSVEYKFDGLTLSVRYENGVFVNASTRGNGKIGEVVTSQASTIKNLPKFLNTDQKTFEIQGECIMKLSSLVEYNSKQVNEKDKLKNARNAAAGSIRNLDAKITKDRNLDFYAFSVGYISDNSEMSQYDQLEFLKENKFSSSDNILFSSDIKQITEQVKYIESIRDTLDFLIDGLVIKVNEVSTRNSLGFTQKFPKWAVAYKFKALEFITKVKKVLWQVSRTGKINPLAIVDEVDIDGAMVKRATLSNYSEIQRKGIKINANVSIRRSNDVIPEITRVVSYDKDAKEITPPERCPSCNSKTIQDGVFYKCSDPLNCAKVVISKLVHFASKDALDIVGLSDKTCKLLFNELSIKKPSSLYEITKDQLLTLEGFKEKKAENLLKAIQNSKKTSLERFIIALGIENIGKKAASNLIKKFPSIKEIKKAKIEEIETIEDFGNIMAVSVHDYFSDTENLKLIDDLISKGFEFEKENSILNSIKLEGLNVVVTGKFDTHSRDEIHKIITQNAGLVLNTVTKQCNLVIAGEKAGSKLEKAKKSNIKIVSLEEFLKMV